MATGAFCFLAQAAVLVERRVSLDLDALTYCPRPDAAGGWATITR